MSNALPARRGTAIRWQAILVAFAIWSGLFQVGEHYSAMGFAPGALGFPLLALALLFAVSFTTPRSEALQRMVISPDRNVGEVRPLFNLLALISGLLLPVFVTLAVFQLR